MNKLIDEIEPNKQKSPKLEESKRKNNKNEIHELTGSDKTQYGTFVDLEEGLQDGANRPDVIIDFATMEDDLDGAGEDCIRQDVVTKAPIFDKVEPSDAVSYKQDIVIKYAAPMSDNLVDAHNDCKIVRDVVQKHCARYEDDLKAGDRDCNIHRDIIKKHVIAMKDDFKSATEDCTIVKDCVKTYAAPMVDDLEAAAQDSRYEKDNVCTHVVTMEDDLAEWEANSRYVKDVAMTVLVAITDYVKSADTVVIDCVLSHNAPIPDTVTIDDEEEEDETGVKGMYYQVHFVLLRKMCTCQ